MTISWTRTIEDRLIRLERTHDRLQQKLAALAGSVARQEARTVPAAPASPAPAVPGAASPPPAPAADPPAVPITGGQSLDAGGLGIWRPSPRPHTSAPGRHHRILHRVQTLNQAVRQLSLTVQRLETMCHLLGQCLVVAVEPEYGAQTAAGSPQAGLAAEAASPQREGSTGGEDGSQLLAGLLPLVQNLPGQGATGGGAAAGGEGEPPDGGSSSGKSLAALAPLLQVLLRNQGSGAARLAAVLGSPAFHQLLGMAGR